MWGRTDISLSIDEHFILFLSLLGKSLSSISCFFTSNMRRESANLGSTLGSLYAAQIIFIRSSRAKNWTDSDLVFCTGFEMPLDPNRVLERFKKLLKQAGLPDMRFHDMRHSVATILLSVGTNPKVVQELLGHNRIQETMDTYSHVLPPIHGEAIKRLEDVLWE